MIRFRMGGGALVMILLIAIVTVVGALDWLGQHAAQIKAGTGTLILAVVVAAALGAAGYLVVQAHRSRQQAAEPAAPVTVTAEAIPASAAPAAVTAPAPRAIEAGPGREVHIHIHTADPAEAAAIIRTALPGKAGDAITEEE